MPSTKSPFLIVLIIYTVVSAAFILSVSAASAQHHGHGHHHRRQHGHHPHRPHRRNTLKLPVNVTRTGAAVGVGSNLSSNKSSATNPSPSQKPQQPQQPQKQQKPQPPPSNGGTPILDPVKPNNSLVREFLVAHNSVRVRLGDQPLVWDKKLAHYARRWASKRVNDCKMIHSMGKYGENIFWGGKDHWTPTEVVQSWVGEQKFYRKISDACYNCDEGEMCGHYTQVVWKDSIRLGCARMKCRTGGLFVICNYDPPGNFLNEGPFGEKCNSTAPSPPSPPSPSSSSSSSPPSPTTPSTGSS